MRVTVALVATLVALSAAPTASSLAPGPAEALVTSPPAAPTAARDERVRYDPTWASLDARPLPSWWSDAKIGIFIHFGVFSVPSFHGEWFWDDWLTAKDPDVVAFVAETEAPGFAYPDYASRFDATFFNATQWAQLFAASGARYVVPTSKHHEGFCLWPSATSPQWNSVDVGPRRDVIGELANATRAAGMKFGLYHSLFEWYNPLYDADRAANWTTRSFVLEKTMPELYDLVERYQPEIIWSDGDWEPSDVYWNSTGFLAWLANDSPVRDTVVCVLPRVALARARSSLALAPTPSSTTPRPPTLACAAGMIVGEVV